MSAADTPPGVGMHQEIPQHCYGCGHFFHLREWVSKLGVLYEGEFITIGHRNADGTYQLADPRPGPEMMGHGRLLWAIWLCLTCSMEPEWRNYGQPEGTYRAALNEIEPNEVRMARTAAEQSANRLAATRARKERASSLIR